MSMNDLIKREADAMGWGCTRSGLTDEQRRDLMIYGRSFTKDGQQVSPEDVFLDEKGPTRRLDGSAGPLR